VEVQRHEFWTSTLHGDVWPPSGHDGFTPAKSSSTHWNGLHGLQSRSENVEVNKALHLPEMKSEIVDRLACNLLLTQVVKIENITIRKSVPPIPAEILKLKKNHLKLSLQCWIELCSICSMWVWWKQFSFSHLLYDTSWVFPTAAAQDKPIPLVLVL
jgi:hypothetical protein